MKNKTDPMGQNRIFMKKMCVLGILLALAMVGCGERTTSIVAVNGKAGVDGTNGVDGKDGTSCTVAP